MSDAPHVLIVEARFYEDIADELARGAMDALEKAGSSYERIAVPGAFEIPALIKYSIRSRDFYTARPRFDGFIALGCVIRGETSHYDLVCNECARGLQALAIEYTLALGFGVLTVENREQAWARASLAGRNKGGEAARACLAMVDHKRAFRLFPR
ncbi:MAG TPA: 6,7-dimethyl-8-ribityllumazine synthase [Alphaproteobacteria bacterium]